MDCIECFYKINQLPRDLAVLFSVFFDQSLICTANKRGQAGCHHQHTVICVAAAPPVVLEETCNVIDANEKIAMFQLKLGIAK